jgi:hypothetical protein
MSVSLSKDKGKGITYDSTLTVTVPQSNDEHTKLKGVPTLKNVLTY